MPKPPADRLKSRTISLSKVVNKWADEMMERKGYENFSAYMAELIRRDKEQDDNRKAKNGKAHGRSQG